MGNVATRLLSLIMLLQSRSSWKAAELADELNVSERTIHRYMTMLDDMGIPIYSERGPYGGFSLVRGYKLPPLVFTPEEATVLYMGANLIREIWGRTYQDAALAATAKLDNVLPDDLRHEVASAERNLMVGGVAARDYQPWEETIHALRQCVIDRRCVQLCYYVPSRRECTERTIEPYGLAFLWGLWYLAGFCHLRQAMRTFRVDRIRSLDCLDEHFEMPDDFSVRGYIAQSMAYDMAYEVRVRLAADVAQRVRDWEGNWMEIVDQEDGAIIAEFSTANLEWATGWVMSYGEAACVLAPQELIALVAQKAQGVLAQYEQPRGDGVSE